MEWILHLGIILLAAKLGAEIFQRLGMSAAIGEIAMGLVLGHSLLNLIPESELIEHLAELGVLFMLFLLGLETKVAHILEVGFTALLVAIGGILVPFSMGFGFGYLVDLPWQSSLFLGTVLCATSVAISTRVFLDCGMGRSLVTRTIIAAAVIDDIVGLIVLTIVLALTGESEGAIGPMLLKQGALLFIGFPLALYVIPRIVSWVRKMEGEGAMFAIILGSTLLFSYGGVPAGFEPIIGAFLVGVIFGGTPESLSIEKQVTSLVHFLAPIFFVHIGLMIDLHALSSGLGFAVLLTTVAAISKLLGSGLGALVRGMPLADSTLIGVGMIPRGEVGLIVAGIGLRAGLFDQELFAATALMCILTIVMVPPLLKPLVRQVNRTNQELEASHKKEASTLHA